MITGSFVCLRTKKKKIFKNFEGHKFRQKRIRPDKIVHVKSQNNKNKNFSEFIYKFQISPPKNLCTKQITKPESQNGQNLNAFLSSTSKQTYYILNITIVVNSKTKNFPWGRPERNQQRVRPALECSEDDCAFLWEKAFRATREPLSPNIWLVVAADNFRIANISKRPICLPNETRNLDGWVSRLLLNFDKTNNLWLLQKFFKQKKKQNVSKIYVKNICKR